VQWHERSSGRAVGQPATHHGRSRDTRHDDMHQAATEDKVRGHDGGIHRVIRDGVWVVVMLLALQIIAWRCGHIHEMPSTPPLPGETSGSCGGSDFCRCFCLSAIRCRARAGEYHAGPARPGPDRGASWARVPVRSPLVGGGRRSEPAPDDGSWSG